MARGVVSLIGDEKGFSWRGGEERRGEERREGERGKGENVPAARMMISEIPRLRVFVAGKLTN